MTIRNLTHTALGIEVESPERGTSEDLERKARPEGERHKKNAGMQNSECGNAEK